MHRASPVLSMLALLLTSSARADEFDPLGWRSVLLPSAEPAHPLLIVMRPKFRDVSAYPTLPEPQLGSCKRAAELLAKAKVKPPAERIGHFAWLGPDLKILGWSAFVMSVEPTDDGPLVTLRVSPHLERAATNDFVTERYLIREGEVRWIDGDFGPISTAIGVIGF